MTTRKLNERHVRWSLVLSQFNFRLNFGAGKRCERSDALSRRGQDVPKFPENPRLKEREFKLLKEDLYDEKNIVSLLKTISSKDIPRGKDLFEDVELQNLWDRGVENDICKFKTLYTALWNNENMFPAELGLKTSLSECSLDDRRALCFRNRLWIPDWEPLRTALIQKSHDSHATGHPGRDSTLAILSRNFYWPRMSTMVRQFCRNCDVCGRSHVWRTRRQGLLLPLPIPERFHRELSIDFMTDLPAKSKTDPRYLMVITDRLLKSITLEAMDSMDAKCCAERF